MKLLLLAGLDKDPSNRSLLRDSRQVTRKLLHHLDLHSNARGDSDNVHLPIDELQLFRKGFDALGVDVTK
jgi:hypothetical protein